MAGRNVVGMKARLLLAVGALCALLAGCSGQQQQLYRPQSSIDETLAITLPDGFTRQSDLSASISLAASKAASQKGVAGNLDVESRYPGPMGATPIPSADPYMVALRDAQMHAAKVATAAGIPLGRITSVHEFRQVMPNQPATTNQIVLEVQFGDSLTVYGQSQYVSNPMYAANGKSLFVRIHGAGGSAADARNSADAFEAAVRSAVESFGIKPGAIQIQGGMINAVS